MGEEKARGGFIGGARVYSIKVCLDSYSQSIAFDMDDVVAGRGQLHVVSLFQVGNFSAVDMSDPTEYCSK